MDQIADHRHPGQRLKAHGTSQGAYIGQHARPFLPLRIMASGPRFAAGKAKTQARSHCLRFHRAPDKLRSRPPSVGSYQCERLHMRPDVEVSTLPRLRFI